MSKQYDSQHQKHSLTRTNLFHIQYTVQWGGGGGGRGGNLGERECRGMYKEWEKRGLEPVSPTRLEVEEIKKKKDAGP